MSTKIFAILTIVLPITLLGQTVEPLSPQLDKFQNVRDVCVSTIHAEVYFTIQSPNQDLSQIVCVKNNQWDNPVLLPFCNGYAYMEPFLSANGNRLYFASDRPKTNTDTQKSDFDIWYVQRTDASAPWSEPINMGRPVNSANNEFYPSLSLNNNLYFTMESELGLGKDDIYLCLWNGTTYANPVLLDTAINSSGYEFNAYISPDETFLIFTRYNAPDGLGSGDLYLAQKNEQGQWQKALNMGQQINSAYMDYCPFYDTTTNTLYFTSKRSSLLPQTFNNLEHYHQYISKGQNGLSKLYKCNIKL